MKEKIKKIFRWLLNNWTKVAEIGTVIWAVNGITKEYYSYGIFSGSEYYIAPVWAYFLSAVLILYLLRKYKREHYSCPDWFKLVACTILYRYNNEKKEREVLLIKRKKEPEKGKWAIPGGLGGFGESKSLLDFAKIEVKSDLCISVDTEKLKFFRITPCQNKESLTMFFYCDRDEYRGEIKVNKKEIETFEWKSKKEIESIKGQIAFNNYEILIKFWEEILSKLRKKYTAVIVLAPDIIKRYNGKNEYLKDNISFKYDIDNDPYEFRFRAVERLYKDKYVKKFILVGGFVEKKEWNQEKQKCEKKEIEIGGNKIPKALVMKDRLEKEYNIKSEHLEVIESASDTKGNAIKIVEYLSTKNNSYLENVGLLTNFYHLPRAIRIFIEVAKLRLIPICAEGLVCDDNYENIRNFYTIYKFDKSECIDEKEENITDKIIGKMENKNSEIKGLGDIEKEQY